MRTLSLALCVWVLSDCRRKHDDDLAYLDEPGTSATPQVQGKGEAAPAAPRPVLGGPQMQGALRVRATLNGGPIPEGVTCDVLIYEQESTVSVRGGGPCDKSISISPGLVDVVVRMSAMGGIQTQKRMNAERIGGEPKDLVVDVPWSVGRLKISHQDAPDVATCSVTIQSTQLSGPDFLIWTLPSGTYSVNFDCTGPGGRIQSNVPSLAVMQGKDTFAIFKVEALAATSQNASVAPTNLQKGPPAPESPQWGVPGLPQFKFPPTGPQSNKTEDLTVQSYNGF